LCFNREDLEQGLPGVLAQLNGVDFVFPFYLPVRLSLNEFTFLLGVEEGVRVHFQFLGCFCLLAVRTFLVHYFLLRANLILSSDQDITYYWQLQATAKDFKAHF